MAATSERLTASALCPSARRRRKPEVHAIDEHVGRDDVEMRARRLPEGRIVADTRAQPARRRSDALRNGGDEVVFGEDL